jgi:murein DD-endopeptidase MepM/ murein hydrolase activator NlpD
VIAAGTLARRVIGFSLLVPGFLLTLGSAVGADPKLLKPSSKRAGKEARLTAQKAVAGKKPIAERKGLGGQPCFRDNRVRQFTARLIWRRPVRPGSNLRIAEPVWLGPRGRAALVSCRSWPDDLPPIEPAVLADGSLLASVGPARIVTRIFLGVPGREAEHVNFAWPVAGPVRSAFGQRGLGWHAGIDIGADAGATVLAAAPGVVDASGWEGSYGWVVKISHQDGFSTIYAHNMQNLVEVGQTVTAGSPLASVGRSGRATGYHLHFEIRRDGVAYNPIFLLPALDRFDPAPDMTPGPRDMTVVVSDDEAVPEAEASLSEMAGGVVVDRSDEEDGNR